MRIFSAKNNLQEGFTLLELIVVFTIIAILSSVGIASFLSYSRTQTLQQSYNDLLNTLNTAKSRAFSQVKPTACSGLTLNGYSVVINTGTWRSYNLNAICGGSSYLISTTNLPKGVSFNNASGTPPTTTTNVFFSLLTSGVVGTGDIVLSSNSQTKTITVTSVGAVQ